ncbi:transmembrane alpha-helix domain-containing protein [Colletotrichum plurivorum]|uniref:Transmembrane alpha-helix domain-containing protein n=1 Tax=Colletotrichum plurivorum TaxID=2175906 RepID=A0A8H6KEG5_9PEZI|nr:transmembrane alpha-helix domain-containing protein [Colletotrichum plurivorum]
MAAAKLDSNAWYIVSETRVDQVTNTKYNNNLQTTNQGLRVYALKPAAWQFHPVGNIEGRYLARLNTSGIREQLSVCYRADEIHPSRTIGCMRDSVSDESQMWDISNWGDGSWKFTNVANGTKYVLDVHPNSNLFMSSEVEGTEGVSDKQVAQHWVMSSERPVNDGAYSTIYTAATTAEASSSTTSSILSTITGASGSASVSGASGTLTGTGLDASATSSSTGSAEPASSGLSPGAAAGIGIGVAIGAVALIGAGVFFWWRRRKAAKAAAAGPDGPEDQMHQHHNGAAAGYSPATAHASTIAPSPSPNTAYKDYYGNEAKVLGHMQPHAHAAEAGNTPIYEAPNEARYELDSGHGQLHHGYQQGPAQLDDTARR